MAKRAAPATADALPATEGTRVRANATCRRQPQSIDAMTWIETLAERLRIPGP